MEWLNENFLSIFSLLFGAGGVGYVAITHIINRRKYNQKVRQETLVADIKSDDFWKNRYDVLSEEMKNKDIWWKERYNNLYNEFQNERQLSNEIIKSFRNELNEIREDYEKQRELDKKKYNELLERYEQYQRDSHRQSELAMEKITQLESLIGEYEQKLKVKI